MESNVRFIKKFFLNKERESNGYETYYQQINILKNRKLGINNNNNNAEQIAIDLIKRKTKLMYTHRRKRRRRIAGFACSLALKT